MVDGFLDEVTIMVDWFSRDVRILMECTRRLLVLVLMLASLPVAAVSREEMRQLNMAYPVGSQISCTVTYVANSSTGQPEQHIHTEGLVLLAGAERAVFDVITTQTIENETKPWLVYRYQLTSTLEETDSLMSVDPDSIRIVRTRYPQYAITTLANLRKNGIFRPALERTEITDFPSYRILPDRDNPDEGIAECGPSTQSKLR